MEVLERKRTVHFHCHRADDIMTAVRLSKEFNFEIVLQHCTEGYRIAAELAKEGISVSLTLVDSPGGKPEVMGLLEENAAILTKAGVKVAINTDDSVTESRFFLRTGAIAVRGGLSEDMALKALTLHGAQMLHLEDRCGSLDKGKGCRFRGPVRGRRSASTLRCWRPTSKEARFSIARPSRLDLPSRRLQFERRRQTAAAPRHRNQILARTGDARPFPRGAPSLDGPPSAWPCMPAGCTRSPRARSTMPSSCWKMARSPLSGLRKDFKLPEKTPVVNAAVVTPGLIDAHAVVGLTGALNFKKADQDQDEMSDPNQADLRV